MIFKETTTYNADPRVYLMALTATRGATRGWLAIMNRWQRTLFNETEQRTYIESRRKALG